MNSTSEPNLKAMLNAQDYASRAASVGASVQGSKDDSFQDAVASYAADELKLHGDRAPTQGINREQPHHVLMCYMQAEGKTPQEIADATGYSIGSVRLVQRQPWFRKRFLAITAKAGEGQVQKFLAGETMNSLVTLVEIRDANIKERPHVSAAAANSILDRALGKPTQHIETETNLNITKAASTANEIDAQINAIEQDLKSRGVATGRSN